MSATQLAAKERETEVAMSADRRLVDLHPGQLGVPEEPLQASSKWLRFARKLKAIAAPLGRKSGNGGGARGWYLGLFLLTCAAPALLALVYYMFVAADQYEVEVRFNVLPVDQLKRDATEVLSGHAAASVIGLDSYVVVQYINSRTMVDQISRRVDLEKIFAGPQADWFSRLRASAAPEDLLKYWNHHVDAFFELSNGSVIVKVRAFTAADAFALAENVLKLSESTVNQLSANARVQTTSFALKEASEAAVRLKEAQGQLFQFRKNARVFDPIKDADANTVAVGSLRSEIASMKAEQSALGQYMRQDSPTLKLLGERIASATEQLRLLQKSLPEDAPKSGIDAATQTMSRYESLVTDVDIAQKNYQSALESLAKARSAADSETVYLSAFVLPALPVKATYPARFKSILLVFLAGLAAWCMASLVIASIRDHMI